MTPNFGISMACRDQRYRRAGTTQQPHNLHKPHDTGRLSPSCRPSALLLSSGRGVPGPPLSSVRPPPQLRSAGSQVETGGDALLAADVSATGEVVAFGSAGGMVHTWAFTQAARVNAYARPPEAPPPQRRPSLRIGEADPWAGVPRIPCMQVGF